jgi:hypothetical protein
LLPIVGKADVKIDSSRLLSPFRTTATRTVAILNQMADEGESDIKRMEAGGR